MVKMVKNQAEMFRDLHPLEKKIGVKFKNMNFLTLALTHSSTGNETKNRPENNERLEFLGDAVLELSITDLLFRRFPEEREGYLTSLRSALVCGENLARVGEKSFGIGEFLIMSRGEEKTGGRGKEYLIANTMEAVIGAIYLDRGFAVADEFVKKWIWPTLDEILENESWIDAKSKFQHFAQEKYRITPIYKIVSSSGPDHARVFRAAVYVGSKKWGEGMGMNKQQAHQAAAEVALDSIV